MLCKKGVLKNFVKLTEKNLCRSFYFCRPKTCNVIKTRLKKDWKFKKKFKNTFFIELLWWLSLPILKPVYSQRHLCKLVSKLVTIHLNILSSSWHFYAYSWLAQAFLLHLDHLVVEDIWRFWFFRSPHNWSVTWPFGSDPLILIQHPNKFWGPWDLWKRR